MNETFTKNYPSQKCSSVKAAVRFFLIFPSDSTIQTTHSYSDVQNHLYFFKRFPELPFLPPYVLSFHILRPVSVRLTPNQAALKKRFFYTKISPSNISLGTPTTDYEIWIMFLLQVYRTLLRNLFGTPFVFTFDQKPPHIYVYQILLIVLLVIPCRRLLLIQLFFKIKYL